MTPPPPHFIFNKKFLTPPIYNAPMGIFSDKCQESKYPKYLQSKMENGSIKYYHVILEQFIYKPHTQKILHKNLVPYSIVNTTIQSIITHDTQYTQHSSTESGALSFVTETETETEQHRMNHKSQVGEQTTHVFH